MTDITTISVEVQEERIKQLDEYIEKHDAVEEREDLFQYICESRLPDREAKAITDGPITTINFKLPVRLKGMLEDMAAKQNITVSELVDYALHQFLEEPDYF